ncbi:MAG TPA: PA0069 family radical SAM protein, partial [Trueperaceae bacterium]|nr:PA0069 family radical SAM protein [Trueperaceae bacterium]
GVQRPHLTVNDKLMGWGAYGRTPEETQLLGMAVKSRADLGVVFIEPYRERQILHDITTGTGDFIANGVVSHNCYARPTHEYLGLSAGLDFERVIMVKRDAAELLEEKLRSRTWQPRPLMLSGVTDPYQPVERRLRVTRSVLEVLARYKNPVSLITKNALVTRDIDVLAQMASWNGVGVTLSITTLDEDLRSKLEPRTATIASRLKAMRELAAAGVPVGVNMAPIIPGLTDHEVNDLLAAAADAGAQYARYTLLRLPGAVSDLFEGWLDDNAPMRKEKVLNRVREVHGGVLDDRQFGRRMKGSGTYATQLGDLFRLAKRRAGIPERGITLDASGFRVPGEVRQGSLFDDTVL